MATDTTARDDDSAARALLEQAAEALKATDPQVPAAFAVQLYSRTVPEDLLRYAAGDLALLSARAYGLLKDREPGAPRLRCATVDLKESTGLRSIGVVEIVNDDMPFLLDSVMGELADRRLAVRLVAHPVFDVERRGDKLISVGGASAGARESFIHLHVDGLVDEAACADLAKALEGILAEVRLAVADWRAMLDRVNGIVADMKNNPPPLPVDELAEAIQFLQWLLADNFTFLGVRNYKLENDELRPDFDSALGIMRQRELRVLRRGTELLEMTPEIMAFLKEPRPLIIAKANIHARVHRRVYLDYIGIKHFDAAGNLLGEQRIVGLFTSTAYTRAAHGIPYLRRKLAAVEARAGFDPGSHSGKALANVLEHYPRDELFQVGEETLYQNAIAILQLDERPRVRVLPRRDRFDRFVSVLVYVPRERYDSDIRARIGDYLASIFVGRVSAYYPFFPEGPLVRVHYIIGRSGGAPVEIPRAKLEAEVGDIVRTWSDGLSDALSLVHPPEKTRELFNRYRDAFSAGFRDVYAPAVAAGDIRVVEGLAEDRPLGVDFHHRLEEEQRAVGLKVWSHKEPLPLSDDTELAALAAKLDKVAQKRLGRSLSIRMVDAGSCNGCELEINALSNAFYDLERFGLKFVASPRHADVLFVTGPVTKNMREALERTYIAMPSPKCGSLSSSCALTATGSTASISAEAWGSSMRMRSRLPLLNSCRSSARRRQASAASSLTSPAAGWLARLAFWWAR